MAKIVLIALVFLAGVIIAQAVINGTTVAPMNNATTVSPGGNDTTAAPTTEPATTEPAPTDASGAIQPMAIFVLACAFLGLLH